MDIIIQSLGFKAGESLENFIRQKVNSVKDDSIIRANVTLYKGPVSNPENDYCEIRLEVPGNDHFVKKHSQYFETSVSECIDILSQMIKKSKDKMVNRRQGDDREIQDSLSALNIVDDNDIDLEDVVK